MKHIPVLLSFLLVILYKKITCFGCESKTVTIHLGIEYVLQSRLLFVLLMKYNFSITFVCYDYLLLSSQSGSVRTVVLLRMSKAKMCFFYIILQSLDIVDTSENILCSKVHISITLMTMQLISVKFRHTTNLLHNALFIRTEAVDFHLIK